MFGETSNQIQRILLYPETGSKTKDEKNEAIYLLVENECIFAPINKKNRIIGSVNGVRDIISQIREKEDEAHVFSLIIMPGGYGPQYQRPGPLLMGIGAADGKIEWGQQLTMSKEILDAFKEFIEIKK